MQNKKKSKKQEFSKERNQKLASLAVAACMSIRELSQATGFPMKDIDDILNSRKPIGIHNYEAIVREIEAYQRRNQKKEPPP